MRGWIEYTDRINMTQILVPLHRVSGLRECGDFALIALKGEHDRETLQSYSQMKVRITEASE